MFGNDIYRNVIVDVFSKLGLDIQKENNETIVFTYKNRSVFYIKILWKGPEITFTDLEYQATENFKFSHGEMFHIEDLKKYKDKIESIKEVIDLVIMYEKKQDIENV
jgi:hypothetical protein